ncbi:MAG: YihY/virulence factor BrkB family protein [Clostridia bacterium]|nr:YihY/virulence factor BrkB family protein [Clostridia bacterium]
MKKLTESFAFVKKKYDLLSVKKYTTIAGTLVFFLIMSLVPLTFWLTLLFGKLPVDLDELLELPVFGSVKNVLRYIRTEAENATTGASVFLLVTTLYSSTNLFYQIRRSGEIIYDYHYQRGWMVRIGALLLMLLLMTSILLFMLVFAFGSFIFSKLLSPLVQIFVTYLLLFALSFFLVLLLNIYVCPYRVPVRSFLPGTLITVGAWTVALIGFGIYLKIGNLSRLYGALSALIVFLLWLYMLMICFIAGVIFNSEKIIKNYAAAEKRKL